MKIESITHESIDGTDTVITTVVIHEVVSQCILARLMIQALGRPGIDNDMELLGSGDKWAIVWTQSKLTINNTKDLVTKALS